MKIIDSLLLEAKLQDFKIFVDMDGVLTNFEKAYYELTGDPHVKGRHDAEFYRNLSKAGEKFWSEMEWMPDGKELWNFIKKYNPTILSAPTTHPSSKSGKIKWIKRELGESVKFILDWNKFKYADSKSILIDDSESKINPWKDHGGIGILHISAKKSIDQIKAFQKE